MSLHRFSILRTHYLHQIKINHGYFRTVAAPLRHPFLQRRFANFDKKETEETQSNVSKPTYTRTQRILYRFAMVSMYCVTAGMIYFAWCFEKYYVKPRKQLFDNESKYSIDGKTREKMIKDMANNFEENMEFVTHKNENIKGIDILANDKFFILYFGCPNCNDQCLHILDTIKSSLKCKKLQKYKDYLSILYIDINMHDSPEKLCRFFTETLAIKSDSNVSIMGLIPKNMETLRGLMHGFVVYIYKRYGDGENMILDHSNMIYFVDKDGLLYDVLGGEDEINEKNVIEKAHNLLYHSESTMMGKLRNIFSLTFQNATLRELPDRHVTGH